MLFLWLKGQVVKRQELINDNTNKDYLNQVVKQQLTGSVIEFNPEVSGQSGPGRPVGPLVCTLNDMLSLPFQNKDLIYELSISNHMLLFISKRSEPYSIIIRHYRLVSKEFQNKVCGQLVLVGGSLMGTQEQQTLGVVVFSPHYKLIQK